MTEHEALVEAILDEPNAADRRLVYADWLEEHGSFADGIRGKLIRLEMQAGDNEKKADAVQEQIKELVKRYSWLMYPPLPPGYSRPILQGGLIRLDVSLAVPRFIEWGEDYLRGLPPHCRLSLRLNRPPGKGKLMTLLDSAAWPRVAELWLERYPFGTGEAERFFADPRLRGLEDLYIRSGKFDDRSLESLARSPHPARLRQLTLYYIPTISDAGLNPLANPAALPKLDGLSLDRGQLSDAAITRFRIQRPGVKLYIRD